MEGTSTLADSLLDDLDDLSDVEDVADDAKNILQGETETSQTHKEFTGPRRKRFLDDPNLLKHVNEVRYNEKNNMEKPQSKDQDAEEYRLIVQSNKQLANLANELSLTHIDLCTAYHPKFPELEELLPGTGQYKDAVRVIRNEMDMTKVNEGLNAFLNSNQIITISVSGSTTSGRMLLEEELVVVDKLIEYMDQICELQSELNLFVESRMEGLAPNVCALIGPTTAAKLLALAGGLAELSGIPACNLQVLGQVKQNAASRAGFSSATTRPHEGTLAECDLVRRCPRHLQKRALKMVAAKLALAARCDYVNVNSGRERTPTSGRQFRSDIESKISQWHEPDRAQVLKALPKPDLTIKKRRGGKRMRRLKERYEETAMMKQANTRAFSAKAGEYGDDAMGLSLGLLDKSDVTASGSLRKKTEKRKLRVANTKASRKRAEQMKATTNTNGLARMELVNPDANRERLREANNKWFSNNAGFQSALPKK
ncbi:predicted protein [Phaeodactylum tricornutum CCAP 1055/1]|uniref:Nop domain-containing protein n=2 Tax=Phaeodactylum tricornutum TaxID=2850 RepID=B7FSP8_PHATC|nr:predicted protein [Phaeodactylum tricornutum CCAP 1055/1]EEC50835.1 predicted protein [Phaeodactylum tricornutum CCAP 1055/1]|eukprot:XP_002178021.1 predicted protein [Phaeodactylum tricornutum CCAP 1055/1]